MTMKKFGGRRDVAMVGAAIGSAALAAAVLYSSRRLESRKDRQGQDHLEADKNPDDVGKAQEPGASAGTPVPD